MLSCCRIEGDGGKAPGITRPPRRRLYAKLNSFKWREGWQNIVVFFGPFLFMFLGMLLVTLLVRLSLKPD